MARQRRQGGSATTSFVERWRRFAERLSLPGIEAWSTTLRTLFLNLIFLIALIVVFPVLLSQFQRNQVIIEPIAVPEALAAQGLTPEVVASRLWDGLGDVAEAAHTSKESLDALPDSRRVEFSFPDSGFSIESLVFHLRRLFNAYETRIAGEFVCADAACERTGMRLRLRVVRDDVEVVDLGPIGDRPERAYFKEAASGLLAILDPFVALSAASESEPLKATILARRLIRGHHKDAKWAHNLIGLIRAGQADYAAAIEEYKAALALDAGFLPARANLGFALLSSKDIDGARDAFTEASRRNPGYVFAEEGFAEVALARGDRREAVKRYLKAADLAPLEPHYLTKAGQIEIDAGNGAEGEKLLARALEIDPGYLPAFAVLAAKHLVAGDNVAAEKIYRDAADYAPDDAKAQGSHGRILAMLHEWQPASDRYRRAIALDPSNIYYRLEYIRCLQRMGRHDEALAEIELVAPLDPLDAEIWMARGDTLRDLGRKAEAVVAYRKFLELDKTESPMRPIIERFIEILSG